MVTHHRRPITTTVLDVDLVALVALVAAAGCCRVLCVCCCWNATRVFPRPPRTSLDLFDTFTLRPLNHPCLFPPRVRGPASPRLHSLAPNGCGAWLLGWMVVCLHMPAYDCIGLHL